MKKETQLKIMKITMWLLIVAGAVSWTIGYFRDQWMAAVGGLAMLVGAGGAYTNIRIRRIEKEIEMREMSKKEKDADSV